MLKIINAMLVVMLMVSAYVLYSLEHSLRKNERQIVALKKEIRQEGENIKLLNAEWSYLIQPERLERLASEHLSLRQVRPYQLVRREELKDTLRPRPARNPLDGEKDPIGEMLKALQ